MVDTQIYHEDLGLTYADQRCARLHHVSTNFAIQSISEAENLGTPENLETWLVGAENLEASENLDTHTQWSEDL